MTLSLSHAILGTMQNGTVATWPAAMTGISTLTIALLMLAIVGFLIGAGLKLRRASAKMDDMLDRMAKEIAPVAQRLRSIADTADEIAASLGANVHQFSDTLAAANEGLQDALSLAERRLKEFDALVRVVQHEAEDAIVSAAATVRGVRAVASAIGEETAAALAFGDDEDDEDREEEMDDGYDIGDTSGAREAEPRIRPRYGRRDRA